MTRQEQCVSAARCDAMRCDATRRAAMRCDVMRCDAMRCDAMRCDAMWCDAMWRMRDTSNPGQKLHRNVRNRKRTGRQGITVEPGNWRRWPTDKSMVFRRCNFSILRSLDTEPDGRLALYRVIFKAKASLDGKKEKKEHRWNSIENHLEITRDWPRPYSTESYRFDDTRTKTFSDWSDRRDAKRERERENGE